MHSQLGQDLWILESTNFKRNGFFIDIGAYDGILHSNTYLLEKDYGWNGICVEPSHKFIELLGSRKSLLDNSLIYAESNMQIEFRETPHNFELSGIPSCFNKDGHEHNREKYYSRILKTLSLTDLCIKYNTPSIIDYLSIDTEGSELKILETHNFNRYRFNHISVEHNRCQEYREKIKQLLISNNYELDTGDRFSKINSSDSTNFDDWYTYRGC